MTPVLARAKTLARGFLCVPVVRNVAERTPGIRNLYSPVLRKHPVDASYGIDTSGLVPAEDITRDKQFVRLINPYIGSQPSIIRCALSALGKVDDYTFVDLGCGKGRAAVIASEFPFRDVKGVELSESLAAKARENGAEVARRFPSRTKITIETTNLADYSPPSGNVVFFNYNSMGEEIHARLLEKLEASLCGDTTHAFFIHYNPVHGGQFDLSRAFERYYAQQIPYDRSELGFGPDAEDAVVIWQSLRNRVSTPHSRINRKLVITKPLMRAELEP